jgi:NAD(P)H-hydrate epimerase
VVDAVFGTGLEREVSGPFAEALAAIRACGSPVLSLDIPSGLHADTGMILGTGVQATVTVTFIALKQGMFTGVGRGYCGHIVFDDLGVPPEVSARLAPQARRLAYANLHCLLTPRSRTGHKGDYGHVLVIGGEQGYGGATRLAGEAAARVGAGLVSVATRPQHASWLPASRPELMGHGVQTAEELEPLLERANVVAIGPGLGQASWGEALLQAALRSSKPLVVDADALNLLARRGQGQRRSEWILTPHPGEAGRLLQCTPGEVQADRFKATAELVARYGGTCVLKGSGTLVLTEGGTMEVVQEGNPGMGSGGMGDLLTGVIAGLVAQGFTMADAARLGACLHGHAGDLAAAEGGERGLLAGDLMPFLRSLANPREAHVRA